MNSRGSIGLGGGSVLSTCEARGIREMYLSGVEEQHNLVKWLSDPILASIKKAEKTARQTPSLKENSHETVDSSTERHQEARGVVAV